jgi:hypothetical protein
MTARKREAMSWKRVLAVVGAALLCLSLVGEVAVAAKKKKGTGIVLNSGSPRVFKNGKVRASGFLKTAPACRPSRAMKLFQTDASGAVLATLNSNSSDANGNWRFNGGRLPVTTPGVIQYVQIKAGKRVVGNTVCRAGFSPVIPVSVPA